MDKGLVLNGIEQETCRAGLISRRQTVFNMISRQHRRERYEKIEFEDYTAGLPLVR